MVDHPTWVVDLSCFQLLLPSDCQKSWSMVEINWWKSRMTFHEHISCKLGTSRIWLLNHCFAAGKIKGCRFKSLKFTNFTCIFVGALMVWQFGKTLLKKGKTQVAILKKNPSPNHHPRDFSSQVRDALHTHGTHSAGNRESRNTNTCRATKRAVWSRSPRPWSDNPPFLLEKMRSQWCDNDAIWDSKLKQPSPSDKGKGPAGDILGSNIPWNAENLSANTPAAHVGAFWRNLESLYFQSDGISLDGLWIMA